MATAPVILEAEPRALRATEDAGGRIYAPRMAALSDMVVSTLIADEGEQVIEDRGEGRVLVPCGHIIFNETLALQAIALVDLACALARARTAVFGGYPPRLFQGRKALKDQPNETEMMAELRGWNFWPRTLNAVMYAATAHFSDEPFRAVITPLGATPLGRTATNYPKLTAYLQEQWKKSQYEIQGSSGDVIRRPYKEDFAPGRGYEGWSPVEFTRAMQRMVVINGEVLDDKEVGKIREIGEQFNGVVQKADDGALYVPEPSGDDNEPVWAKPDYDIVIGGAQIYEGVDLQVRTCAIHHLDQPWTPNVLTQRNGRAVRQGNLFSNVSVYAYLTDGSIDYYKLNRVRGRKAWQDTVLSKGRADASIGGGNTEAIIDLIVKVTPVKYQAEMRERVRKQFELLARRKRARIASRLLNLFRGIAGDGTAGAKRRAALAAYLPMPKFFEVYLAQPMPPSNARAAAETAQELGVDQPAAQELANVIADASRWNQASGLSEQAMLTGNAAAEFERVSDQKGALLEAGFSSEPPEWLARFFDAQIVTPTFRDNLVTDFLGEGVATSLPVDVTTTKSLVAVGDFIPGDGAGTYVSQMGVTVRFELTDRNVDGAPEIQATAFTTRPFGISAVNLGNLNDRGQIVPKQPVLLEPTDPKPTDDKIAVLRLPRPLAHLVDEEGPRQYLWTYDFANIDPAPLALATARYNGLPIEVAKGAGTTDRAEYFALGSDASTGIDPFQYIPQALQGRMPSASYYSAKLGRNAFWDTLGPNEQETVLSGSMPQDFSSVEISARGLDALWPLNADKTRVVAELFLRAACLQADPQYSFPSPLMQHVATNIRADARAMLRTRSGKFPPIDEQKTQAASEGLNLGDVLYPGFAPRAIFDSAEVSAEGVTFTSITDEDGKPVHFADYHDFITRVREASVVGGFNFDPLVWRGALQVPADLAWDEERRLFSQPLASNQLPTYVPAVYPQSDRLVIAEYLGRFKKAAEAAEVKVRNAVAKATTPVTAGQQELPTSPKLWPVIGDKTHLVTFALDPEDTLAVLRDIALGNPLSHPAGTNPEALFFILRSSAGPRLLAIPVQWQGREGVLRGKQGTLDGYQVRHFRLDLDSLEEIAGFAEGLSSAMESLLDAPANGFISRGIDVAETGRQQLNLRSDKGTTLGRLVLPSWVGSIRFSEGFLLVDDV